MSLAEGGMRPVRNIGVFIRPSSYHQELFRSIDVSENFHAEAPGQGIDQSHAIPIPHGKGIGITAGDPNA